LLVVVLFQFVPVLVSVSARSTRFARKHEECGIIDVCRLSKVPLCR
jgi:hypothetical protein